MLLGSHFHFVSQVTFKLLWSQHTAILRSFCSLASTGYERSHWLVTFTKMFPFASITCQNQIQQWADRLFAHAKCLATWVTDIWRST